MTRTHDNYIFSITRFFKAMHFIPFLYFIFWVLSATIICDYHVIHPHLKTLSEAPLYEICSNPSPAPVDTVTTTSHPPHVKQQWIMGYMANGYSTWSTNVQDMEELWWLNKFSLCKSHLSRGIPMMGIMFHSRLHAVWNSSLAALQCPGKHWHAQRNRRGPC